MEELRSNSLRSLPSEMTLPEHINSIPSSRYNKMKKDKFDKKVCDTIEETEQAEEMQTSRAFIKNAVQNRTMNENNLAKFENATENKDTHHLPTLKDTAIEFKYIESRHGEMENNNLVSEDSTINENDDENIQTRIENYNLSAQVRLGNNQFTMANPQSPTNDAQNIPAPRNNVALNINNQLAQNPATEFARRVEKEVEGRFRSVLELSSFMIASYITFYLIYQGVTGWLTEAIIVWVYSIIQIIEVYKTPINPFWEYSQRKMRKFFMCDWVGMIVCVLGLVLRNEVTHIYNVNLISTPFVSLGLVNLIIFVTWTPLGMLYVRRKWIAVMKRTIIWAQMLLICLKNDTFLDANWKLIMIPALVGLGVLMVYQVVILYNLIYRLAKNNIRRAFGNAQVRQQVVGLGWLFLMFSFADFWFVFLVSLDKLMAKNYSTSLIKVTLIVALVHAGILILVTLLFRKSLKALMKALLYQTPRSRFPNREQRANYIVKFEPFAPSIKYLALVSATFHQVFTEEIKSYSKDEIKEWKKSIAEAKKNQYLHRNGLNRDKKKSEEGQPKSKKDDKRLNKSALHIIIDIVEKGTQGDGLLSKLDYSFDDAVIYKDIKRPRRQNHAKDNENLCYICVQRKCTAVVMGCGHSGICYECALESWRNGDKCVMCRQPIDHILKIKQIEGLDVSKCIQGTKKVLEESANP